MGLLASGGITYAWISGAQTRRAANKGLLGGTLVGVFLLSPAGLLLASPILGSHAVARYVVLVSPIPEPESAPAQSRQAPAAAKDEPRSIHPLLWAFGCPLFGLAGGFAIDRTRSPRMLRNLAVGLLLSALAIILMAWLGSQALPELRVCADIIGFVSGWWLGLVIYPSVEDMLAGPPPFQPAPATETSKAAA